MTVYEHLEAAEKVRAARAKKEAEKWRKFYDRKNQVIVVVCYKCETKFEPSPPKVKEWAESSRPFEPTDWECDSCK